MKRNQEQRREPLSDLLKLFGSGKSSMPPGEAEDAAVEEVQLLRLRMVKISDENLKLIQEIRRRKELTLSISDILYIALSTYLESLNENKNI